MKDTFKLEKKEENVNYVVNVEEQTNVAKTTFNVEELELPYNIYVSPIGLKRFEKALEEEYKKQLEKSKVKWR